MERAERTLALMVRDKVPTRSHPIEPKRNPRIKRYGVKCGAVNSGFTALLRKGREMIKVLMSKRVPDDVYEERLGSCGVCPHAMVYDINGDGVFRHYCQCCGCPAWQFLGEGSDMESKCKHAALECPRPEPAFGAWEG